MLRLLVLFCCFYSLAAFSAPQASGKAATQVVYKCKDARGKFIFQQVACDESQVTGTSTAHVLWRQMRSLSSEGKNALSVLGANVESIKQCNKNMSAYNEKVNALDATVANVARNYKDLAKAHMYLKDCGVCRTSAQANCMMADKYLDQAVSKLTEY